MRLRLPRLWRRARVEDWPPPAPAVHPIEQYWALAFLLHVWVVLMFGTLQGGTAKPGEGVWGSLTVSLVGLPGRGEAPTRSTEEGALAPARNADPGSAQAAPQTSAHEDVPADRPVDAPPPVEPAVPPTPDAPPPAPAPEEPLPALAPAAPPVTAVAPEPVPVSAVAPPTPEPAVIEPAAPLPPPVAEAKTEVIAPTPVLSPTLPALTVPQTGAAIATVPAVRPLPEMARLLQRVPASLTASVQAASAVAQAGPAPPPVVSKPVPTPQPPPPANSAVVQPTPAPAAPPETALPTVVMRQLSTEAVPALPRRSIAADALSPAARPLARLPEVQTLATAERVGAARRPVVQGQPQATAAMSSAASGAAASVEPGQVSAAAPAPPASTAKLILELPRGGAMASQGVRGVLQMLPPPPERRSKLGDAVDKAAKTDCREAYQKNGLLAVVPLVADAVRDKGCQW